MKQRAGVSLLRFSAMGGKFLVVSVAAVFISPGDVGLYGQVAGLVTLAVLVVGLDYYTHANRELVAAPTSERPAILFGQFRLYARYSP